METLALLHEEGLSLKYGNTALYWFAERPGLIIMGNLRVPRIHTNPYLRHSLHCGTFIKHGFN